MAKRSVDIVVGTMLAVAVTPLLMVLALMVAAQFRTSPFFLQHRVGRGGRLFRIIKLRTLPPQSPVYADKYSLAGVTIPPLGALLRRLHLDELPQLWLVPFGHMSLVGPRPEMAFLHDRMSRAQAQARALVRPGCTGLWQVSIHADALIHEHPEYDLAYISGATLRLDMWIMWQTVRMLCGLPRQVTLQHVPTWAAAYDVPAVREREQTAAAA